MSDSCPPSLTEPHWQQLQLSSVTRIPKIDGKVFLMERVTWRDYMAPNFTHSIFDHLSFTGTPWIWDKVIIN